MWLTLGLTLLGSTGILAASFPPISPFNVVCAEGCNGLRNGDYQSCNGCDVYANCKKGKFTDNIPCPDGLVFDAMNGECATFSHSCKESTGYSCIDSCEGLENGDYQSCSGCDFYATCAAGVLYDRRPCAVGNQVWDDNLKRCDYTSSTCEKQPTGVPVGKEPWQNPLSTGELCIESCVGKGQADYQSCDTCDGYITCAFDEMYIRFCPAGLVWDDALKRCDYSTSTCSVSPVNPDPETTGDSCITSCKGQKNGDYQSCEKCTGYITCTFGSMWKRNCYGGNVWDDVTKRCEKESSTCTPL